MATQGFQLSQFDRAPNVPSNIGVVDTKGIYGAVVDALKANEALRTTQAVQAATDAELVLARDKARTEQTLLGPEAESRRSRANLLASEAASALPGVEGAARARRALDAVTSQTAELGLGNVPARVLADRAQIERAQRMDQAMTQEAIDAKTRADQMANTLAAQRAQASLGMMDEETELARAELQRKMVEAQVMSDPAIIRRTVEGRGMPASAQNYLFAQRILNDPNSTPEQLRAAQIMIKTAPTASSDPTLRAQQSFQAKRGTLAGELELALPKLERSVQTFERKTNNFDQLIDQAAQLVGPYTTGFGSLIDRLPASDALALAGIVESLQANIGFDALQEMRVNSPTGGALGNVSDFENRRLSSTIVNLDTRVNGATFLSRLQTLRDERQKAVKEMRKGLNDDRGVVDEFRAEIGMPRKASVPANSTFNFGEFKVTILPPETPTR